MNTTKPKVLYSTQNHSSIRITYNSRRQTGFLNFHVIHELSSKQQKVLTEQVDIVPYASKDQVLNMFNP